MDRSKLLKKILYLLICLLVISLLFGIVTQKFSCSKFYPTAKKFNATQIDNSFNNLKAGGKITFNNGELFVVYNNEDFENLGGFKVNDNSVKKVTEKAELLELPSYFTFNNTVYCVNSKGKISEYSEKDQAFVSTQLLDDNFGQVLYLSDNFSVYEISPFKIKVKSKEQEYVIPDKVFNFSVQDNTLYYFNRKGALHKLDLMDNNTKSIKLLNCDETPENFLICGDYCYFTAEADKNIEALYRYSISKNKKELVLDKDVKCLNSFADSLYCATSQGIYVVSANSNKLKKISNIKTEGIYIVDKKWIYTYDYYGSINRITMDGKTVEKVKLHIED